MYRIYTESGVTWPQAAMLVTFAIAALTLALAIAFALRRSREWRERLAVISIAGVVLMFGVVTSFYLTQDFSEEGQEQMEDLTTFLTQDCGLEVSGAEVRAWWLEEYEPGTRNRDALVDSTGNRAVLTTARTGGGHRYEVVCSISN